jgi:hypothetical protein
MELIEKARLPGSGFCADSDDAPFAILDLLDRRHQHAELFMAANERGLSAGGARSLVLETGQLHHWNGAAFALQLMGSVILQFEDIAHQTHSFWTEQNLSGFRQVFETCRQVDGVTQRTCVGSVESARAGHDYPRVDSRVHHERTTDLLLVGRTQLLDCGMDLEGGAHCPFGVIFMGHRVTEHGHHGIPQQLVDPTRVTLDDLSRPREDHAHNVLNVLWIEVLRHRREAGEITENDGDLSPLTVPTR